MSEKARLSFSSNGSEVILNTQYGSLNFTSEEYSYYENLYRIIDCLGEGDCLVENVHFYLLLVRTNIDQTVLENAFIIAFGRRPSFQSNNTKSNFAIEEANKEQAPNGKKSKGKKKSEQVQTKTQSEITPDTPTFENTLKIIHLHQWLMLCKMIAHFQETSKIPSERVFRELHSSAIKLPLADFNLGKSLIQFSLGRFSLLFQVKITGWQLYGEDSTNQHTKYNLLSVPKLENETGIVLVEKQRTNDSGDSKNQTTLLVERRYSEFELLSNIFLKFFKGFIVPPLPPKNWNFLVLNPVSSEVLLTRRVLEFQMFLNDVTTHPILSRSFELKSFLTASTNGFKSFVDLYQHYRLDQYGKPLYSIPSSTSPSVSMKSPDDNNNASSGINKFIQHSTSVISQSAGSFLATAKSIAFVNNLWGNISKTVSDLASPLFTQQSSSGYKHFLHNNPEDILLFTRTNQFLEQLTSFGKLFDTELSHEEGKMHEMSKLAQCLKNVNFFL
jgi:hypothetical protein